MEMQMTHVTLSPTAEATAYQALIKQHGAPLLVLDCHVLADQCRRLQQALPGVDLFYAIKSLPHRQALLTLQQAGVGFDLASTGEIELVKQVGGAPRRTVHTHPIKRDADIRAALRFGCTSFVVDNADNPLLVAGGGGGTRAAVSQNGCNASLTQFGTIASGSGVTTPCTG